MVTWPMTSRDPKRSRSWPRYRNMHISRKRWQRLSTNWPLIENGIWRIECTRDRWRHVTYIVKTVTQLFLRSNINKCSVFTLIQSFRGRSLGLCPFIFLCFQPGGSTRPRTTTPNHAECEGVSNIITQLRFPSSAFSVTSVLGQWVKYVFANISKL